MEIEKWWARLPESVRSAIKADPTAPLSSEAVIAITRERGIGPSGTAFEGRPMDFHLTAAEARWVTEHEGA